MMKKMQQSVCALAVLAATAFPAMAVDSIDLQVIGTIKPAACTPTLSGDGVVDYGNIGTNILLPTDYAVLPEHEITFTVTCDALARVAIQPVNGRPGSLAGATEGASGFGLAPVSLLGLSRIGAVGLGKTTDDEKIGGFAVRYHTLIADGRTVNPIYSNNSGSTWAATNGELFTDGVITSAALPGTLTPVPFSTLTGLLRVQAYLNKSSELNTANEIAMDGLATFEVVYL